MNSDFTDSKTGKPDDRAWLDHQISSYVETHCNRSQHTFVVAREEDIYHRFAPINNNGSYDRPSWSSKIRKVKREMIGASIARLIESGELRIAELDPRQAESSIFRRRSTARENTQRDKLIGSKRADELRYFKPGTILDALVDALDKVS